MPTDPSKFLCGLITASDGAGKLSSDIRFKHPLLIAIVGGAIPSIAAILAALIVVSNDISLEVSEPCLGEFRRNVSRFAAADTGWKGSPPHRRDFLTETTIDSLTCASPEEKGAIVRQLYVLGALKTGNSPMNTKGFDLRRADLAGMNLRGISLANSNLERADLSGRAILTDADLSFVHGSNIDLRCAEAAGIDLSGARLVNADLRHANLFGAVVDNSTVIIDAKVFGANLQSVDLEIAVGDPNTTDGSVECE